MGGGGGGGGPPPEVEGFCYSSGCTHHSVLSSGGGVWYSVMVSGKSMISIFGSGRFSRGNIE